MLNRLFAVAFVSAIFLAPFAGMASMAGGGISSASQSQQKSLCIVAGVGCGSGHVLLPAIGRF
ncbi:sugar transporter [Roseibium sp.]|uniref:sugar transporter n=1 Tax=Roseibium sp. TaxID=1936156 RepID=UPI003A97717D